MTGPAGRLVHHYGAAVVAWSDLDRCSRWRVWRRRELEDRLDFHCRAADLARMELNQGPLAAPGLRTLLDAIGTDDAEAAAVTMARVYGQRAPA